jgi:hypothetical protein
LGPLPQRWSIASCLFPHEENIFVPGPGPHPVLIAGVIPATNVVLAVYGSGQSTISLAGGFLHPYQFEISPNITNGLTYVTRFDFRKARPIDWKDEWFRPMRSGWPIIMGSLDLSQRIKANTAATAYQSLLSEGKISEWGKPKTAATIVQILTISTPTNDDPKGE